VIEKELIAVVTSFGELPQISRIAQIKKLGTNFTGRKCKGSARLPQISRIAQIKK
jgi:hypothetical protein